LIRREESPKASQDPVGATRDTSGTPEQVELPVHFQTLKTNPLGPQSTIADEPKWDTHTPFVCGVSTNVAFP